MIKVTTSEAPEDEQGRALPRVFVAEPSAAIIERLVTTIDDVAEVVGRATNARDALHGIRKGNPHLAVLDVAIPNGIDLLKQIKSDQPPLIVAVLTHSAEETTRRVCLRLGAAYFLDKIHEFNKVREIVLAIGGGWDDGTLA